jgi:hypothetical protein
MPAFVRERATEGNGIDLRFTDERRGGSRRISGKVESFDRLVTCYHPALAFGVNCIAVDNIGLSSYRGRDDFDISFNTNCVAQVAAS